MESPLLNYRKDRAKEYPSVEEQLDMLFHEIKEIGFIAPVGGEYIGWATYIQGIKDANPKPAGLNQEEADSE